MTKQTGLWNFFQGIEKPKGPKTPEERREQQKEYDVRTRVHTFQKSWLNEFKIIVISPAMELKVEADQPSTRDGDGGPINKTAREMVESSSDKTRMESSCSKGKPDATLTSGALVRGKGRQRQGRSDNGNPRDTLIKLASMKDYTQEDLDAACEAVAKGMTVYAAARNFGVPWTVVWQCTYQIPGAHSWTKKKDGQTTVRVTESSIKRKSHPISFKKTRDMTDTSGTLLGETVQEEHGLESNSERSTGRRKLKKMFTRKFSEQDTRAACKAVAQGMSVTAAARNFGVCFATVWRRTRGMVGVCKWQRRKYTTGTRMVGKSSRKRKFTSHSRQRTTDMTSSSGTVKQEGGMQSGDTGKARRNIKAVPTKKYSREHRDEAYGAKGAPVNAASQNLGTSLKDVGKRLHRIRGVRGKKQYSEDALNAACEAVAKGMSVCAAGKRFSVPYTTMWKHTRQLPGIRKYSRRKHNNKATRASTRTGRRMKVHSSYSEETMDVMSASETLVKDEVQWEYGSQTDQPTRRTLKARMGRTYSQGDLDEACEAVAKGSMSAYSAAKKFGLPYTTVWKRTRHLSVRACKEAKRILSSCNQRMRVGGSTSQQSHDVASTSRMHDQSENDNLGARRKRKAISIKKYSQADMNAACEAVAGGMPVSVAAQNFGIPAPTVWKCTRQIRGVRSQNEYSKEDMRAAIAAVQKGMSVRGAARKYGINSATLRCKIMQEFKLEKGAPGKETGQM